MEKNLGGSRAGKERGEKRVWEGGGAGGGAGERPRSGHAPAPPRRPLAALPLRPSAPSAPLLRLPLLLQLLLLLPPRWMAAARVRTPAALRVSDRPQGTNREARGAPSPGRVSPGLPGKFEDGEAGVGAQWAPRDAGISRAGPAPRLVPLFPAAVPIAQGPH